MRQFGCKPGLWIADLSAEDSKATHGKGNQILCPEPLSEKSRMGSSAKTWEGNRVLRAAEEVCVSYREALPWLESGRRFQQTVDCNRRLFFGRTASISTTVLARATPRHRAFAGYNVLALRILSMRPHSPRRPVQARKTRCDIQSKTARQRRRHIPIWQLRIHALDLRSRLRPRRLLRFL